jgi:hypothetical protein
MMQRTLLQKSHATPQSISRPDETCCAFWSLFGTSECMRYLISRSSSSNVLRGRQENEGIDCTANRRMSSSHIPELYCIVELEESFTLILDGCHDFFCDIHAVQFALGTLILVSVSFNYDPEQADSFMGNGFFEN